MSSSGRYQSRLFSFFSHQSLRLKDKTSQAWRQVKLAAVWGTQIALYPIYAVFQTGRLLGRQMGRAQVFPRLQTARQQVLHPSEALELAVDAPIRNVLGMCFAMEALEGSLPNPSMLANSPLNPPKLGDFESLEASVQVRGVAVWLATRSLVLVTAENEILDVLTDSQQLQLQRQMVGEMADFWRQRKSHGLGNGLAIEGNSINTFLPLPKEKAHLLPPVRAFRRLMAWIQLSPVAIAANLFQESRLMALDALEPVPDRPLLPSAQWSQTEVDQQVNEVFDAASKPLPLLAWVKNQAIGLADFSRSLSKFVQNSSMVLYDPLPKSEPDFATEPPLIPPDFSPPNPKPTQKPWLLIEDFFTGEFLGVTGTGQIVQRSDELIMTPDRLEEIDTDSNDLVTAAAPIDQVTEGTKQRETPLLEAETWEAEVTGVTYETHPLEQLLKWLDSGMLWIEQKLADVWDWMKRS
jgi:hypothetical protein